MCEFIFRACNLTKIEAFFMDFVKKFQRTSSTIKLPCFYRTLSCMFVVIANTLCTIFLRYTRIMLTISSIIKISWFPYHVSIDYDKTLLKIYFFFNIFFFFNLLTRTCSSAICITISSSLSAALSLRAFGIK